MSDPTISGDRRIADRPSLVAARELAQAVISFCEREVPEEWDGGGVGYAVSGLHRQATEFLASLASDPKIPPHYGMFELVEE